jgi:hypothetical protein
MNATIMLGVAAVAALLLGRGSGASGGKPQLKSIPGGKAKKPKAKAAPSKPHAIVLTPSPAALPADTRSMAQRAAEQPVPSDMQPTAADSPVVDLDQSSAAEPASAKPLAKPKKPKPPKKRGGTPPSAAKLAKPAKRTGKQAASDLKDYMDNGGNPGSDRSLFAPRSMTWAVSLPMESTA